MTKICRKTITLICVVCLLAGLAVNAGAAEAFEKYELPAEYSTEIPLYVNGIRVGSGILVEDATYVSLRTFCEAMDRDIQVNWDSSTLTAVAEMEGLVLEATLGDKYITANDRCFYVPNGVMYWNGSIIAPIAELSKAFGATVIWDEEYWTIDIYVEEISPVVPAEEFYPAEDFKWLCQVIHAESGNQPLAGMIAVGNVVLNRVADPTCPDTVYDVVFDRRYGVQFSVTENGTIYLTPNELSIVAAKICMEGYDVAGASLFFVNPDIGATSWFTNNRTFVASIGDHDFYA